MEEFLKHVPAKSRTIIEIVLEDDEMTIEDKLEHLSEMGISSEIIRLAEKFLNNEVDFFDNIILTPLKPLVDVDFLSRLAGPKVNLARHYIAKGNFTSLDKFITSESKEIQDLYRAFKEYYAKNPFMAQKIADGKLVVEQTKTPPTNTNQPTKNSERQPNPPPPDRKFPSQQVTKQPVTLDSTDEETEEDDGEEEDGNNDPDWAPNIAPEFFAKFPECLNILILGETGVGKSTFLNGLANYLKHANMHEAKRNGIEILIKSRFIHMDEDFNRMRIECEPTVKADYDEGDNEELQDGESSTQSPKAYQFEWGPSESRKRIRLIDTPGVGDVRGLSQEQENFAKILQFIADYKEIHAILILLKPNNARLTVTFRFCINELLTHLHSSASKNILFCFTNARQTLYKPGDSLPALKDHLDQLHEARGIRIPLQQDTVFCFDNESFRFLSAWKSGAHFEDKDIQNFDESWKTTVNETFRLFKKISTLETHKTEETLSINNIRAVILAMARPLAEIAKSLMANAQLIDDKVKEVEDLLKQGKSLATAQLQVEQVSLITKEVDYPTTVCTSDKCVEIVKLGAGMWETYYKQKCHHRCGLIGVQTGIVPNLQIKSCACFGCGSHVDRCSVCHCDWTTHLHIRYELQRIMTNVVDPSVTDSIKNNDDKVKTAQLFIDAEKKRKANLERESKKISSHCIEFAAFLKKNSIVPYNDVYKEYVEHLIREENAKVSQGGSSKMLHQLQKYRDEYEQQVKVLEGHGSSSFSNRSIREIYQMLDDLKNMKNCGSLLQEIQKLEMLSVRQEQTNRVLNVNIQKGWLDSSCTQKSASKSKHHKKKSQKQKSRR